MNKRDLLPIIILGMHRSGTSCLAGSLQQMGLNLGSVHTWNPHNKKGNRESAEVVFLNDEILRFNGGSWDVPPSSIEWLTEHEVMRNNLLKNQLLFKNKWGFKDPRTLLTFNFWTEAFQKVALIGTIRHPHAVATSLHKRNGMTYGKAFELWEIYNTKLLMIYTNNPFPLIRFDVSRSEYIYNLSRAARLLELPMIESCEDFFDETLRHEQSETASISLPPSIASLWEVLNSVYLEQGKYAKN